MILMRYICFFANIYLYLRCFIDIYMEKNRLFPDYIFESSWEVCNKVGGIYTVLSTRALTLTEKLQDRLIFIGPDCWGEKVNPYFSEDDTLYAEWKTEALKEGLNVKVGRWQIPGEPVESW